MVFPDEWKKIAQKELNGDPVAPLALDSEPTPTAVNTYADVRGKLSG